MSKPLFNRNDPASIKAALEMTQEEFVAHFTESTTSSANVLSDLYDIIRKNNKAAIIQRNSGTAKNDEPIETILPITNTKMMTTDKIEGAPVMRTEFADGETIRVPMDHIEKMEPLEVANAKAVAKANKGTKPAKEKVIKEKTAKTPKTEKVAGAPTKQDKILTLLEGGATNKEIKLILAEDGQKVYDSEIANAKKKLTPSTEA